MHFGLAYERKIRYTDAWAEKGTGPDLQQQCNKRQRGVLSNEKAEEDPAVCIKSVYLPICRYVGSFDTQAEEYEADP